MINILYNTYKYVRLLFPKGAQWRARYCFTAFNFVEWSHPLFLLDAFPIIQDNIHSQASRSLPRDRSSHSAEGCFMSSYKDSLWKHSASSFIVEDKAKGKGGFPSPSSPAAWHPGKPLLTKLLAVSISLGLLCHPGWIHTHTHKGKGHRWLLLWLPQSVLVFTG